MNSITFCSRLRQADRESHMPSAPHKGFLTRGASHSHPWSGVQSCTMPGALGHGFKPLSHADQRYTKHIQASATAVQARSLPDGQAKSETRALS